MTTKTKQTEPTTAPAWVEPDQLYLACHDPGVSYPKRVIWPDGETTYRNGSELYQDLWARAMAKEAQGLGGVVR